MFRAILCMGPLEKVPFATFYPRWKYLSGTYFSKKDFFKWTHVFNFIDRCNLFFSTLFKGIIRKECQSFTNHGHDKTPPTVFNPLSLWPHSITRAILACLWFAQYDVQGDSMNSILSIDATYFFNITKKRCRNPWVTKIAQNVAVGMVPELLGGGNAQRCRSSVPCCTLGRRRCTKVSLKRAVLHPRATISVVFVAEGFPSSILHSALRPWATGRRGRVA